MLAAKGVSGQVCEKGTRGHPLTEEQKARNRQKSIIARGIGLVRNPWAIALTNLVYNLARYGQIVRLKLDTWNHPAARQHATSPA